MEMKTNGGALRSTMMPTDKFSCLERVMILLLHNVTDITMIQGDYESAIT